MPKFKDRFLHELQYILFLKQNFIEILLREIRFKTRRINVTKAKMINLPTKPNDDVLELLLPASLASSKQWWRCSSSVTPSKNSAYWATARS